ncbi:MAG: SDR family oxidoreductase [Bacteroidales bacterium]|nr:SDR family oxidoreductase [Bacteroidales bacterium]MCB9028800.1 SDR family oxidoreductase [Bacteroidales bacterium]MDD3736951.1 SDR family oxidoreductase [Bacteroidales bacterium]HNT93544.1 SDR family oxidoreductase [Bacteroidales bacterium]HOO65947.1 SDR family oxidoreductase [Bacteroidales bacterium]
MRRNVFRDKVVIVTGASSGIGRATALEFARNASKVVIAARNAERLSSLEQEITGMGAETLVCVTDVSKEEDCRRLIEKTVERFGTVHILINNAGISMRALFDDVEISVLKRLMDVNFWGTVYCTKYALPYLVANRGSIVGVSSTAGFHGLPGRTGYSASKFAIHGFLETVRIENLREKLHVMIIAPGFTTSEVRRHALLADGTEQGNSPRPEKKLMSAEHVARWILKGIRKKKRNKIMTWAGRFTALLQRVVPALVDYAYYLEMKREPNSPLK